MNEWKLYKVSELCSDIIDCVNKTAPISEAPTPYKMLRTSDIRNGFINTDNLNSVTGETFEKWTRRGKLQRGDIIFTREAPLGEAAIVREAENYFLGQRLVLYRANPSVCDNRFLLYVFLSYETKQAIIAKGNGATVLHLRVPECGNIEIKAPDIKIQKRIGDILSAYDDLIENNQKQIKLLEEAAQRQYKEWFVDMRFSGYETTPIVNGIPEGWVEGTLADLAVFKRGKTITKGQVNEGNVPVVAGGLEPAYYHDTPNTDAPVITVSGSGANAGFTRMYHSKVWASDCSYIDSSVTHDIGWIYCFLKENKASIDAMQKGAAQPHVYAKDLNAMKVVIPCDSLMEQFRTVVEPMFSKIGKLEMQIKQLTEARDRLLPKLMSGEIEV